MKTSIHFGLYLDGYRYLPLEGKEAISGHLITGPKGFLNFLETHLGLKRPRLTAAKRIISFESVLKQLDDSKQFYSRSLEADSWATAERLLRWRDGLIEAGWTGKTIPEGGERLAAFAEIEKALAGACDGTPDQLRMVLNELERTDIAIEEIKIADPLENFPYLWRKILEKFRTLNIKIVNSKQSYPSSEGVTPKTDLEALRGNLVKILAGESIKQHAVKGDGTLVLVRATTLIHSAEFAGAFLSTLEKKSKIGLILSDKLRSLDYGLKKYGVPASGSHFDDSRNPAAQLLKLAFAVKLRPVDPHAILDFLNLPICPIPQKLRYALIAALSDTPGYPNKTWDLNLERVLKEAASKEDADRISKALNEWLVEGGVSREKGFSIQEAIEICNKIIRWAKARLGYEPELPHLECLVMLASEMTTIFETESARFISEVRLRNIFQSVCKVTLDHSYQEAEVGHFSTMHHPGALLFECDTVFWWNFVSDNKQYASTPWHKAERTALEKVGCVLEHPSAAVKRERDGWYRAALNAKDRLIFVFPESAYGDTQNLHPFWDDIVSLYLKDGHPADRLTQNVGVTLTKEGNSLLGKIASQVVTYSPLPKPGRIWDLGRDLKIQERVESPNSMGKLLGCPMSWLLDYGCKIRPRLIFKLPEGSLLFGTFAHEIMREIFSGAKILSSDEASKIAAELIERELPRQASALLLSGRERERSRLKTAIVRSAGAIASILAKAKLEVKGVEISVEKDMGFLKLGGRLDMIVSHAVNGPGIIDLKWGGRSFREKEISEEKSFQLTIYGNLLMKSGEEKWPAVAYFLIGESIPITLSGDYFGVPSLWSSGGGSMQDTWSQIKTLYLKHKEELSKGRIHILGIPSEESSGLAPLVEAACSYCDYPVICGKKFIDEEV